MCEVVCLSVCLALLTEQTDIFPLLEALMHRSTKLFNFSHLGVKDVVISTSWTDSKLPKDMFCHVIYLTPEIL